MSRQFLFCDCGCGQPMAIDYGDKVVIKARHHGQDHLLTIDKPVVESVVTEPVAASSSG